MMMLLMRSSIVIGIDDDDGAVSSEGANDLGMATCGEERARRRWNAGCTLVLTVRLKGVFFLFLPFFLPFFSLFLSFFLSSNGINYFILVDLLSSNSNFRFDSVRFSSSLFLFLFD